MTENSTGRRATRLLVEGAVIVASILLAFGIDAWWDARTERTQERALLTALAEDLAATKEVLGYTRRGRSGRRPSVPERHLHALCPLSQRARRGAEARDGHRSTNGSHRGGIALIVDFLTWEMRLRCKRERARGALVAGAPHERSPGPDATRLAPRDAGGTSCERSKGPGSL